MKKHMKKILAGIIVAMILLAIAVAVDARNPVPELVKEMSLRDKVTQMLMVSVRHWDETLEADADPTNFTVMNEQVYQLVEDYNFGAVIYFAQNLEGTEQAYHLTTKLQEAAVKDGGIPMLISADQEGGSVYRLNTGTALPGNMALGAIGDSRYAYEAGQIIGSELSAIGINTNLAPVVDVNNNANNPVIGLRSYSDDPGIVGDMASATIKGMAEYNVIGCAKHFPGHGDTATDSHYGLPCVDKDLETLQKCELVPYQMAIDKDIEMIMTAHILYPQLEKDTMLSQKTGKAEALPATMSDDILTGLLKEDMNFKGIVVTDAMNMEGITASWEPVEAVVNSIQAGADMICMPCTLAGPADVSGLEAIVSGIEAAVSDGTIPMSRMDDAVTRILTVKHKRHILDLRAEEKSLEHAQAAVGNAENREAEREMAASAVTVVRNENNTLPLSVHENSKVLFAVPYENEKAQTIMGWNRAKEAGLIPDGAQAKAVRFDKETTIDTYKAELDWADTIIFNSEVSRAEKMNGGSWESAYILEAIEYAEGLGKTTIVQSVDKPYDVQSYPVADAVLAVYGCKGSGIDPTEALVGGITESETACGPNIIAGVEVVLGVYGAKGTLPVNIPKFSEGTYTPEILFERGYGLTYDSLTNKTKK